MKDRIFTLEDVTRGVKCPKCNSVMVYDRDEPAINSLGEIPDWRWYIVSCPSCDTEVIIPVEL